MKTLIACGGRERTNHFASIDHSVCMTGRWAHQVFLDATFIVFCTYHVGLQSWLQDDNIVWLFCSDTGCEHDDEWLRAPADPTICHIYIYAVVRRLRWKGSMCIELAHCVLSMNNTFFSVVVYNDSHCRMYGYDRSMVRHWAQTSMQYMYIILLISNIQICCYISGRDEIENTDRCADRHLWLNYFASSNRIIFQKYTLCICLIVC